MKPESPGTIQTRCRERCSPGEPCQVFANVRGGATSDRAEPEARSANEFFSRGRKPAVRIS
jgi:hypothetical protein